MDEADFEHIVYKGDRTLCQEDADRVEVAMLIDDATCPLCIQIDALIEPPPPDRNPTNSGEA